MFLLAFVKEKVQEYTEAKKKLLKKRKINFQYSPVVLTYFFWPSAGKVGGGRQL